MALFHLSSEIDGFKWFCMENLHKNIQLMLKFLKGPFLVLHFSCSILMTFLMMLSVISLSMLMILRDVVDWGRKWLVDFNAGKTQQVLFDWSNKSGATDVKIDGSALKEKSYFKMLGLTFSSKLDWGS